MNLTTLPEGAQRPPKKAIWSWTMDMAIWSVIFAIPVSFVAMIGFMRSVAAADRWWFVGAVTAAYLVLSLGVIYIVPRIRYRYTYYLVSHDQLMVQRGAFWIKRVAVPFARVQNIDTQHGPIDRKLGLINVTLHTAASPVVIKNVATETGEAIRDEMMTRVKSVRDQLAS